MTGGAASAGIASWITSVGGASAIAAYTAVGYIGLSFIGSGGDISSLQAMASNEGQYSFASKVSDGALKTSLFKGGEWDPTGAVYNNFIERDIFDKSGSGGMGVVACRSGESSLYSGYPAGCDFMLGAFQGKCDRGQFYGDCQPGQPIGAMYRPDLYEEGNLLHLRRMVGASNLQTQIRADLMPKFLSLKGNLRTKEQFWRAPNYNGVKIIRNKEAMINGMTRSEFKAWRAQQDQLEAQAALQGQQQAAQAAAEANNVTYTGTQVGKPCSASIQFNGYSRMPQHLRQQYSAKTGCTID